MIERYHGENQRRDLMTVLRGYDILEVVANATGALNHFHFDYGDSMEHEEQEELIKHWSDRIYDVMKENGISGPCSTSGMMYELDPIDDTAMLESYTFGTIDEGLIDIPILYKTTRIEEGAMKDHWECLLAVLNENEGKIYGMPLHDILQLDQIEGLEKNEKSIPERLLRIAKRQYNTTYNNESFYGLPYQSQQQIFNLGNEQAEILLATVLEKDGPACIDTCRYQARFDDMKGIFESDFQVRDSSGEQASQREYVKGVYRGVVALEQQSGAGVEIKSKADFITDANGLPHILIERHNTSIFIPIDSLFFVGETEPSESDEEDDDRTLT